MSRSPVGGPLLRLRRASRAALVLAAWLALTPSGIRGLPPGPTPPGSPATQPEAAAPPAEGPGGAEIIAVGCTNCGNGLLGMAPPPGSGAPCACGGGSDCVPGRTKPCYPCTSDYCVGRFLCGLYECICCPDPCYEPHWIPLADSAFFVDSTRPQTQQRLRYDNGQNVLFPDRSEFFWARADGKGKGPRPPAGLRGERGLRYDDLSLYTEGATGSASFFTEMTYRSIDPVIGPHVSGFTDLNLGTKALLFDCELLQLTFQFRTYLPTGNFTKGLGVGHVSLEPSLLLGVKLAPDTYFQAQLSEWIPLGGDNDYMGSILHYHTSVNQVLYRVLPDVPLIGTLETNGWSFQDGLYTDPVLGPQKSSGGTYFTLGAGLRLFVCDKIDFGIAASHAVTAAHWAEQLYRAEFRWRY